MVGVQEAHLLNLSVARGLAAARASAGACCIISSISRASYEAQRMFLEVRPSNVAARALYADNGLPRSCTCGAATTRRRTGARMRS